MFPRPLLRICIKQMAVAVFYFSVERFFCYLCYIFLMSIKTAEESIPIIVVCKVRFLSEIDVEICISKIMSSFFVMAESSSLSKCHCCEDRGGFKDVVILILLFFFFLFS